jgi:hypothetical protein
MTVRIGSISLTGVQDLHTEEARALVEQRAPEQQGGVMQDLGREPLTIVVVGVLYSAEALADLEQLRGAQLKGEPQRFAADIVAGSEITRVVVAEVRIQQLAGYVSRYRYQLYLREYNDPPQSRQAARAKVQATAVASGASRAADGLKAAEVLKDPSGLPKALEKQPGLLKRLKAKDLASAVGRGLSSLSGEQVAGILSAVASRDPAKLGAMFQSMLSSGQLAGMVASLTNSGLDLRAILSDSELAKLGAFGSGLQLLLSFLKELPGFVRETKEILNDWSGILALCRQLEKSLRDAGVSDLPSILDRAQPTVVTDAVEHGKDFLRHLAEFCSVKNLKDLCALATSFQCQTQFRQGIENLSRVLKSFADSVNDLAALSAQFDAVFAGLDVLLGAMNISTGHLLLNLESLFQELTGSQALFAPIGAGQLESFLDQAISRGRCILDLLANALPSEDSLSGLAATLVRLKTNLDNVLKPAQPEAQTVVPDTS